MAFVSQTRIAANAWLRPGNTAACSNGEAFMAETFDILRDQRIGLVRGDSGFNSEAIQSYLEGLELDYIIAVRAIPCFKHEIYALKQWVCTVAHLCAFIGKSGHPLHPSLCTSAQI